jgi:sulfhydrogenase subunit beta (sulfur reductase)
VTMDEPLPEEAPSKEAPSDQTAVSKVVTIEGLDVIVQILRNQGRKVFGPVVRDGVITHDEIDSASELPIGWTEEQDGATYRLAPTGTNEVFAFSSPSTSWKRFVYPERTLLITAKRKDGSIEVKQPPSDRSSMAFFGIRSCDLAALAILDRVFLDPAATDPNYASLRRDVFVIAAACAHPGNTCFCASMDTGPSPRDGFDLSVAERYDQGHHEFLITAGTSRGQALLAEVPGRDVSDDDNAALSAIHDHAVATMGRHMDLADPPAAAVQTNHPRWDDVAERCLACGNCTMVCPTCFCGATEDVTDLTGEETERWRVWDSCFTLDFSHLHGGSIRHSTGSRYRQWLLHKLVTWHDQFGSSGCVGCGRCITWCPVGIDLTAEIAALAQPAPTEDHREKRVAP